MSSPADSHLHLGAIIFPRVDQSDFTGPFEVLSRLPNSTFHVISKDKQPVRDGRGLVLTPEKSFSEAPLLDLLIVPGGPGQEGLMDDEVTLSFIRHQAGKAKYVFLFVPGRSFAVLLVCSKV